MQVLLPAFKFMKEKIDISETQDYLQQLEDFITSIEDIEFTANPLYLQNKMNEINAELYEIIKQTRRARAFITENDL